MCYSSVNYGHMSSDVFLDLNENLILIVNMATPSCSFYKTFEEITKEGLHKIEINIHFHLLCMQGFVFF